MRRIKKYSTPRQKMNKMNYGQAQLINNNNSISFKAMHLRSYERRDGALVECCVFLPPLIDIRYKAI